jgi:hypothetical protein
MNKKANKKAFFIILCVGLMYASLALNITERFTMKRIFATEKTAASANIAGVAPEKRVLDAHPSGSLVKNTGMMEPGFLIAVPVIGSLVQDGILEKNELLRITRADGVTDFKKPFDILRDQDVNGLVSIAESVGKKQIMRIITSRGITLSEDLNLKDIVSGKGYMINNMQLRELYTRYVNDQYSELFPLRCNNTEVKRKAGNYEVVEVNGTRSADNSVIEVEWTMPDLTNLAMREALEHISGKTSKIKVLGVGYVVDQNPKPHEKLRGEVQCSLYGRPEKQ